MFSRLLLLAIGISLAACATSPEGRSQLALMPDSQMDQMGAQAFTQLKSETPISRDQRKTAFVKCVASLVVKQLQNVDEGKWEIQVFESKEINAFALPGRKIGVYTGILEVTENGDQLAAIIGHEVGHVIANHGNERVSQALVAQIGLAGVNAALDKNSKYHGTLMTALGVGAQFGIMAYGRTQESESDMIGVNLMARAGFDPRQSVKLWENMKKKSGGGGPPEWLSTHPSNETRIKDLNTRMPPALELYAASNFKDQAARCIK